MQLEQNRASLSRLKEKVPETVLLSQPHFSGYRVLFLFKNVCMKLLLTVILNNPWFIKNRRRKQLKEHQGFVQHSRFTHHRFSKCLQRIKTCALLISCCTNLSFLAILGQPIISACCPDTNSSVGPAISKQAQRWPRLLHSGMPLLIKALLYYS